MSILFIGKPAPDFSAKAVMPDNSFQNDFNLKTYLKNSKGILFFYPLDFTFVCPSEIISFHNKIGEFAAKKTKIIGVSVDSHFSHLAWKNTPHNKGGVGRIQFPLVSDLSKSISKHYHVLNEEEGISMRGTFFIDENFILRHMLVNDLPIGRSVEEALRIVDAWDHFNEFGEVCPAGWQKGDEAMQATSEGVADYLASNADKL
ncbi:MAG: peroxiredoxin [Rickettsiaceae bacterium]|nr:peroxiredoxin [Rickettsiaceae bacterium]